MQCQGEKVTEELPPDERLASLEQYFEAMVLSFPDWCQKLFETRKAMFTVDKNFALSIQFEEEAVPGLTQQDVVARVMKYLEQNTSPIFEEVYLH